MRYDVVPAPLEGGGGECADVAGRSGDCDAHGEPPGIPRLSVGAELHYRLPLSTGYGIASRMDAASRPGWSSGMRV